MKKSIWAVQNDYDSRYDKLIMVFRKVPCAAVCHKNQFHRPYGIHDSHDCVKRCHCSGVPTAKDISLRISSPFFKELYCGNGCGNPAVFGFSYPVSCGYTV